jgi:hypothetical protein
LVITAQLSGIIQQWQLGKFRHCQSMILPMSNCVFALVDNQSNWRICKGIAARIPASKFRAFLPRMSRRIRTSMSRLAASHVPRTSRRQRLLGQAPKTSPRPRLTDGGAFSRRCRHADPPLAARAYV